MPTKETGRVWITDFHKEDLSAYPELHELSPRSRELLRIFLEGIAEVERDEPERVVKVGRIPVALFLDEADSPYTIGHDRASGMIYISRNLLRCASDYDAKNIKAIREDVGEFIFCGMFNDLMFFWGIEEAHHAYFFGQVTPDFYDPMLVTLATYDSQEHELAALEYQLQVAVRKGLPSVTIDFLEKRIGRAKFVREDRLRNR